MKLPISLFTLIFFTTTEFGLHTGGRNYEDVEGFAIVGHRILLAIPQGIAESFPNLQAFEWINGDIRTIDSSIFDGDLFQHLPRLRVIYFYNNLLYHVGLDLLTGLTE